MNGGPKLGNINEGFSILPCLITLFGSTVDFIAVDPLSHFSVFLASSVVCSHETLQTQRIEFLLYRTQLIKPQVFFWFSKLDVLQ